MEDGKTSVSKEELEKVHSQVRNALVGGGSSSGKHGQRLPPIGRWRYGPGSHKAVGSEGRTCSLLLGGANCDCLEGMSRLGLGNWLKVVIVSIWTLLVATRAGYRRHSCRVNIALSPPRGTENSCGHLAV